MLHSEDKNGNVHHLPGHHPPGHDLPGHDLPAPPERRPDMIAGEIETLGCLLVGITNPDPHASASRLIDSFGSLPAVLHADAGALARHGLNSGQILILQSAARACRHVGWSRIEGRRVLVGWSEVQYYLMKRLAHLKREHFIMLCLDNRNRLIASHDLSCGTVDRTCVHVRELVQIALNDFAKAVILAHNHPSGETEPSRADITMTAEIRDVLKSLGMSLHDHLIITPTGCVSFKSLGMM